MKITKRWFNRIYLLPLCIFLFACSGRPNATPSLTPGRLPPTTDSTLPLKETWCLTETTPISIPIYHDGLVYTFQENEKPEARIVAYEENGKITWTKEVVDEDIYLGTPGYWMFEGDYLVFGNFSSVNVLNAKTGVEIWHKIAPTNTGMATGDGKVFVSQYDWLIAYDLNSGDMVWKIPGQDRSSQAPLYIKEQNLLLLDAETYRLVNARTGEVTLDISSSQGGIRNGSIVSQGKYVRINSEDGMQVLDAQDGKFLFSKSGYFSHLPVRPFATGNSLVLNTLRSVEVMDLSSGEILWEHPFASSSKDSLVVSGGPVAMGNMVFVILSDGTIRALNFKNGEEIGNWQGQKGWNKWGSLTPFIPGFALGEKMLFASFGTNELCAFSA